ncbi:TnsD family Tn7-like transposition protein [Variovorax sp. KK3]|uniref:TnsD family Tn7-like transposition protein n=1 Tax=Variovorax sp. KK3 TaxID=1855728 RepID=UPI00097BE24D
MSTNGPLPYAPPHLEDETLYSYLGRLNAYNCLGLGRRFLHSVFGSGKEISSADLPTTLAAMIRQWPEVSPYPTIMEVIERSTNYPYHRPFMPCARWEELVERASHGPGGTLKIWLGLVAQRFSATATFRSCIECDRFSWDMNGTLYWRRSHLLPGVVICPIHQIPLVEHFAQSKDTVRTALRLPPLLGAPIHVSRVSLEPLTRFALTSSDVLRATPSGLTGDLCSETYLNRLREMGLCSASGRIRWQQLSSLILQENRFFDDWRVGSRIAQHSGCALVWLRGLLNGHGKLSHPLTHVVLINCLFGSFSGYVAIVKQNRTECDNCLPAVAAPPFALDTRSDAGVCSVRSLMLIEVDSCASIAARRREDLPLPIAGRSTPITTHRIAKVETMLRSGTTPVNVAKLARLSLSSVYRIRRAMLARAIARPDAAMLENFRQRWLQTQLAGHSVRQRRVLDGEAYAWLYRHDRQWLTSGSGLSDPPISQSIHRARVDWESRDKQYAERIAAIALALKSRLPRPRVSTAALMRMIAPLSSIRSHLHRLPLSQGALIGYSESISEYQRERYAFASRALSSSGGIFPEWKALRLAGLRRRPDGELSSP